MGAHVGVAFRGIGVGARFARSPTQAHSHPHPGKSAEIS
ncbi:Uncharacterised protein [Amycolatopsis camponoti]|uniref:Uncharacterized protein n=1 Tax=Amycolatopsis camponoti TaxID=2606593 RepID=A0A6I8LRH6_9PSEU|nr:Uncharacterised protein [Amycolatopsis camponoti]